MPEERNETWYPSARSDSTRALNVRIARTLLFVVVASVMAIIIKA